MKKISLLIYSLAYLFLPNQYASAQSVANYVFSPAASSYTPISSGFPLPLSGNLNDGYANNIPIGFTFVYNSEAYTSLAVSTNGFICLGNDITSTANATNNLSTGTGVASPRPIIAPLWDNLNFNNSTDLSYLTLGNAPNRTFIMQWQNARWGAAAANPGISFQARLYEADSKIEFVYRSEMGLLNGPSASIGLSNMGSGTKNFLCLTSTSNNTFDTSTLIETNNLNTKPNNGQVYTFAPKFQVPLAPSSLSFTNVTGTQITLNWTDNTQIETYYLVYMSTDNINFNLAFTIPSSQSLGTGTAYQQTFSGLVPGNTYHFRVFACNEGSVPTNFAAATQATAAGLLSGTKSICPTGCDYTSIGNACNDIRSKGVDGALILELMSTYAPSVETYPLVFGNLLTTSSNTITLRAHSGVSSPIRFFSTASSTFVFNNTNYLSIDGLLGGSGRAETIQIGNNSSNGSAVQFINGSTNNNISNCRITGNSASIGSGIIGFLGTNTTEGNNYNSISNCSIKDTLGQAIYCVYSLGNTNIPNLYNSIFNNYIYNYYNSSNPSYGVFLGNGNNSWFIANNHFYQTSSRSLSNTHTGAISISSGAAYSIISNFIGGSEPNCGGASLTYSGAGLGTFIRLNIPANNTSVLLGNTIQNITLNCSSYIGLNALIFLQNGAFNVIGNTLGSDQNNLKININNATGTAQFSPIYVGGGSSYGETQITYNTISGMNIGTGGLGAIHFIGVHIVPAIPTLVISDNLIGSLTQNNNIINNTNGYTFGISGPASASQTSIISNTIGNIFSSSADTNAFVRGISISSGGSFTLKNNRIFKLSAQNAFARTGVNASLIGILQQASGLDQVCENNQVSELYLSNQVTLANNHIYGIWYAGSSSGTNILSGNFVHTIGSGSNGLSSIIGIYNGNSAVTATNNRIRLGIDSLGNSQSKNHSFIGLQDQGNSNSYYHNSIYIGGQTAGTASANSMSFFNAIGSTGTRNIINNIFFNARTFTTGTAKNYAFFLTSNSLVEFLLDHNIYFAPNTGGIMGRFNTIDYTNLNSWRAATFSDFNSAYGNPNFVNPNAALGALTLKIQSPTPAEGSGMLIPEIGEDFESESRVSMTPNDIGADAGNYSQVDLFIPSIDYLPLSNTSSTANRTLQVQIKDPGAGVNNSSSLRPRLYFRRIAPSATAWQSTQGTLNTGTTRDGIWSFTIDYALIGLPVVLGNGYQYYVVVQDSANPANIFFSPFAGANHVSVNSMVTAPTTPNRYNIVSTLPTNIQVGIGQTYTSLSGIGGLFAAINAGVLGGNTVATLVSNTSETGINALTNAGLSGFNLLIKPDNSQRVISGSVNTGLLGMIAINGAVGVTIDGGPNKNLVFRNAIGSTPNASTSPAMRIRSGKFDTIQNCIIEGNSSNNGVGVVNLGTINISSPSEGIVIQNNLIRAPLNDSLNAPNTSIIVNSAAGNIDKCRISGNFISDFNTYGIYVANAGKEVIIGDALDSSKGNTLVQRRGRNSVFYSILVGSGNSHVIGHNKIYNQQIFGHNAPIYGIYVFNTINNINITHNSIGGSAANRSGEPYRNAQLFTPILVNAGNIQTTTIQYNKIGNISLSGSSGTFTGIYGIGGKLLIQHNSIGNGQNSGLIYDTIGTAFNVYGIRYTSTSNVSILNNALGSFANNGTGYTVGISIENGTANLANNTICDISTKNSIYNNVDYSCVGIRISGGTSDNNIENNRIYNLSNTSNINGASITGIAVVGAIKASNIHRNRLYNFFTNDSRTGVNSPIVRGIYLASGASIYHNNQISLTQDIPFKNVRIRGIEVNTGGGNNQFFYNTIYIGGVSYGANNSAAFFRNTSGTTTAVEVVNNILYNERSGGGLHYGLSANQNTNFIQDNNLYVAKTNTEMAEFPFGTSRNLTAWNGLSGNPLYNISNTNIALLADSFFANKNIGNLGTQSCRVANLAAFVSVQTDFLNQTRNIPSDIGSTEFNTVLGYPTINVQPISDTINCTGGNAFFAIKASGSGLQYQWQIWDSTQWLNLLENALYTGVNTDTLHIILPNTNLHGKLYRCLVRGVCSGADSSSSARLHMITNNFWTGAVNTNWNNTGNWSCGVLPTANTDAIINNVSNLPIISDSIMTCFKLSIAPGASLTLNNAASKLAIYGNTELNGSLINANGTIAFAGNTLQNIPGNSYHKLEINNATGTQITGNVQVVNQINLVNGTIQLNQFNLSLMGNTSQIYGASSANKFIVSNDTGCLVIQQIGTGNRIGVVQFPIGSNQNSYTPLSIQNTGISNDFRARVMPQVYNQYAANGTPMGAAYTSLAVNKTWYVREAIAGGSNANVSFTWNIADELLAFNRSSSYAASYAGAQWLGGTASMAGGVNPYVQSLSGQTSFNLFGVASGGILPVNLIQFYGQKADEHVQLYWQTASEKNSKTFEIERSLLGTAFEKVGEIAAAVNSETKRRYQFADYSIQRQTSYFYRLKQIDLDGSIAYSRVIYIPENSLGSDQILVYPNPFTENIFIKTLAFTETILAVNMYDLKGNKVYSETNLSDSAVSLNKLANISAGMYFLEVETKQGTQRIKLLKE